MTPEGLIWIVAAITIIAGLWILAKQKGKL